MVAKKEEPFMYKLRTFSDEKGYLGVVENNELDFEIVRCYFFSSPEGVVRGNHANKSVSQILCVTSGSVTVDLIRGTFSKRFDFNEIGDCLFIPSGYWRSVKMTSKNVNCVALADRNYDKNDYIYDISEFNQWVEKQ